MRFYACGLGKMFNFAGVHRGCETNRIVNRYMKVEIPLIWQRIVCSIALGYIALSGWFVFHTGHCPGDILVVLLALGVVLVNLVIPSTKIFQKVCNIYFCVESGILLVSFSPGVAMFFCSCLVLCLVPAYKVYPWMRLDDGSSASVIVYTRLAHRLGGLGRCALPAARMMTVLLMVMALFPAYFLLWLSFNETYQVVVAAVAATVAVVLWLTRRSPGGLEIRLSRKLPHRVLVVDVFVSIALSLAYIAYRLGNPGLAGLW